MKFGRKSSGRPGGDDREPRPPSPRRGAETDGRATADGRRRSRSRGRARRRPLRHRRGRRRRGRRRARRPRRRCCSTPVGGPRAAAPGRRGQPGGPERDARRRRRRGRAAAPSPHPATATSGTTCAARSPPRPPARGGTATEREGRWGTELECQVQVRGPDGRSGTQPSRIVGINGTRWLLRATFLGRPAVNPDRAADFEDVVARVVVRRGDAAMAPGEPLPVELPDERPPHHLT